MLRLALAAVVLSLFAGCAAPGAASAPPPPPPASTGIPGIRQAMDLPSPALQGTLSFEECLVLRRSVRQYSGEPLGVDEVSQLLWAAQGVTADWGGRTAPSAGGLYPLELYLVAGDVDGMDAGVYHYEPGGHSLERLRTGDLRPELSGVALYQESVAHAGVVLVLCGVYERTTEKYGDRGFRYVHMETGHAAQNALLQATALELGAVVVGAFDDARVAELLCLADTESPLYLIPVGRPR